MSSITVTLDNGKSASCHFTVEDIEPTDISLPGSLHILEGSSATLTATLSPSNASTALSWWSDDNEIAYVSGTGMSVSIYGKKPGETIVHVETTNGHVDFCKINVISTEPTDISIGSNHEAKFGKRIQLPVKLYPTYAKSAVKWTSDNNAVASVSNEGMVRCVGKGTAKITAETTRGNKKASCIIKVAAQPTHFVLVLRSGERVAYSLVNDPKVFCESEHVVVEDGDARIEYPIDNVRQYSMGVGIDIESVNSVLAAINDVKSDYKGLITQKTGALFLSGFTPRSEVNVYSINGVLIRRLVIGQDGNLEIPLSQFTTGVYILKTQNQSIKFTKR